jgi:hypothetical protein
MGPLCVTDPEYELYNQEIQSFGHFAVNWHFR